MSEEEKKQEFLVDDVEYIFPEKDDGYDHRIIHGRHVEKLDKVLEG